MEATSSLLAITFCITYKSDSNITQKFTGYVYKLSYSEYNDKFRLLFATYNHKNKSIAKNILNLSRILSVKLNSNLPKVSMELVSELFLAQTNNSPIIVEITKERNSLERFLLQFASFDRKTEYDAERDIYTCQLFYDIGNEAELLIRILSFGHTIRVLGPPSFLYKVKERLLKQYNLTHKK